MKQEALDKLKKLRAFASGVGSYWEAYDKTISKSSCDKHGAMFNGDSRFTVFKTKEPLRFDALHGYYGNSGCTSFSRHGITDDLANEYLPKALNNLKRKIFAEMAKLAENDAAELTSAAEDELAALQKMVDKAKQVA